MFSASRIWKMGCWIPKETAYAGEYENAHSRPKHMNLIIFELAKSNSLRYS